MTATVLLARAALVLQLADGEKWPLWNVAEPRPTRARAGPLSLTGTMRRTWIGRNAVAGTPSQ